MQKINNNQFVSNEIVYTLVANIVSLYLYMGSVQFDYETLHTISLGIELWIRVTLCRSVRQVSSYIQSRCFICCVGTAAAAKAQRLVVSIEPHSQA